MDVGDYDMNQDLLKEIRENINKLEEMEVFQNAKIFLFGMNTPGDYIVQYLEQKGYFVNGILDNNPKNTGKTLIGVKVFLPEILKEKKENARILICSKYYEEMRNQLETMGYKENINIFKLLELNTGTAVSVSMKIFNKEADYLKNSIKVYNELTRKYTDATQFILCPVKANGDVYMGAGLIEAYKKFTKAEKVVFVIVGSAGKKIAALFDLYDVVNVTQSDMEALTALLRFLGSDITNMHMIHPEQFYFNIFSNMECFRGLNFIDFMAEGMLGLKSDWNISQSLSFDKKRIRKEYYLTDRDILIAPYANSLPNFPINFWRTLVDKLNKEGYQVYTNSGGDTEPPVVGTAPLFLPIEDICDALDDSGGFIGIRNGLSDLVSRSKCKKIILYPDKGMGFSTVKEYYSVNGMGLCDDAKELIYTEGCEKDIIEEIVEYIKKV